MKEFLQNILCLFDYCFNQAGAEKNTLKICNKLGSIICSKGRHSSFHHCAIKRSWERLFANTASQGSEYDKVLGKLLQQILQYFWSSSRNSSITVESTEKEGEMTIDLSVYDECDFTNIEDHADWVVKRTRETLTQGGNKIPTFEYLQSQLIPMLMDKKLGLLQSLLIKE